MRKKFYKDNQRLMADQREPELSIEHRECLEKAARDHRSEVIRDLHETEYQVNEHWLENRERQRHLEKIYDIQRYQEALFAKEVKLWDIVTAADALMEWHRKDLSEWKNDIMPCLRDMSSNGLSGGDEGYEPYGIITQDLLKPLERGWKKMNMKPQTLDLAPMCPTNYAVLGMVSTDQQGSTCLRTYDVQGGLGGTGEYLSRIVTWDDDAGRMCYNSDEPMSGFMLKQRYLYVPAKVVNPAYEDPEKPYAVYTHVGPLPWTGRDDRGEIENLEIERSAGEWRFLRFEPHPVDGRPALEKVLDQRPQLATLTRWRFIEDGTQRTGEEWACDRVICADLNSIGRHRESRVKPGISVELVGQIQAGKILNALREQGFPPKGEVRKPMLVKTQMWPVFMRLERWERLDSQGFQLKKILINPVRRGPFFFWNRDLPTQERRIYNKRLGKPEIKPWLTSRQSAAFGVSEPTEQQMEMALLEQMALWKEVEELRLLVGRKGGAKKRMDWDETNEDLVRKGETRGERVARPPVDTKRPKLRRRDVGMLEVMLAGRNKPEEPVKEIKEKTGLEVRPIEGLRGQEAGLKQSELAEGVKRGSTLIFTEKLLREDCTAPISEFVLGSSLKEQRLQKLKEKDQARYLTKQAKAAVAYYDSEGGREAVEQEMLNEVVGEDELMEGLANVCLEDSETPFEPIVSHQWSHQVEKDGSKILVARKVIDDGYGGGQELQRVVVEHVPGENLPSAEQILEEAAAAKRRERESKKVKALEQKTWSTSLIPKFRRKLSSFRAKNVKEAITTREAEEVEGENLNIYTEPGTPGEQECGVAMDSIIDSAIEGLRVAMDSVIVSAMEGFNLDERLMEEQAAQEWENDTGGAEEEVSELASRHYREES